MAVIMTSGTVANLWPAVAEAQLTGCPSSIPLRRPPPSSRDNGANQAIDQQGIFRSLSCPSAEPAEPHPPASRPPRAELGGSGPGQPGAHPGPVHFNCMYPEPSIPARRTWTFPTTWPLGDWLHSNPGAPGSWPRPLPPPAGLGGAPGQARRHCRGRIQDPAQAGGGRAGRAARLAAAGGPAEPDPLRRPQPGARGSRPAKRRLL